MVQFNDTSIFQEVIAIKDLLNKNTCPIAKCSLFDLDCSSPLPSNNVIVKSSPLSLEAKTNIQEGYSIKFCLECLTDRDQVITKEFLIIQESMIPVFVSQNSSFFEEIPKDNFTINAEEKPIVFNYFSPKIVKATQNQEIHISSSGFDQLTGSQIKLHLNNSLQIQVVKPLLSYKSKG